MKKLIAILFTITLLSSNLLFAADNEMFDFGTLGNNLGFYDHFSESGPFIDTGTFSLATDQTVNGSLFDLELGIVFDIANLVLTDNNGNELFSQDDFTLGVFTFGLLPAGAYTFNIAGNVAGTGGGAYQLGLNAVPLPAAAWLFGSALLGFVGYSARRKV